MEDYICINNSHKNQNILIEDLKKKLGDIFKIIEEDHNKVLKYYSKEIENSVIKFENIMLSNDEGIKKNKKNCSIFNKIYFVINSI